MEHSVCVQYGEEISTFIKWIKTQPQLPQNIKPLVLLNFLKKFDFDQEKAQQLLMLNLKIRNENSHAFTDRDLKDEKIQCIMRILQISFMPHNTDDNRRVTFTRITDDDPDKFVVLSYLKLLSISTDVRAVTTYPSDGLVDGDISVFDAKGVSFRHLKKMLGSFSLIRPLNKYAHESLPQVIYQNHWINCPQIFTRIMALFRPFLTKQVVESTIFHRNHEKLHEYLPKKVIPFEYGGDAGKIDDIYEKTVEIIEQFREYLNDDSYWKISN